MRTYEDRDTHRQETVRMIKNYKYLKVWGNSQTVIIKLQQNVPNIVQYRTGKWKVFFKDFKIKNI
jgi:hypothetical protein